MIKSLPTPTPDALAHSHQFLGYLIAQIQKNNGFISFADYMNLALYHPNFGYYISGTQKFNVGGDFTTAPEISSLFSQCIAKQCEQIFPFISGKLEILEFGAGTGRMAADILSYLAEKNALPHHYYILELSAELKKRQEQTIANICPDLLPRVHWLKSLPVEFSGVILANEVLDAMPVHRFHIADNQIHELGVTEKNGTLAGSLLSTKTQDFLDLFTSQEWPGNYTSEINLNIQPWIASLSACLKQGVILLVDYGFSKSEYYHPQRTQGTLMCHYQHQAHADPFYYPGLQDITAHVDFSAVYQAAIAAGLEVLGYTQQASFLLGCGLIDLLQEQNILSEKEKAKQNHAINLLTSPAEMGELFKVMMLGKKIDLDCVGFSLSDKQDRLTR
jgi:SAM-dependent MidA family methyltransferase